MALTYAAAATAAAAVVGGAVLLKKRQRRAIEELPAKMRRVVLAKASPDLTGARLEIQEVDTPKPRPGQVLVKLAAAPINPSDDGIWRAEPPMGYPLPLGIEASGTVVASGGGLMARRLLGQKVAVTGKAPKYAEYAIADAMTEAFALPDEVPVEDGCGFFVNPFTVVGIVETVQQHGSKAFIHTAAASQLGQMMVKYCKQVGMTLVNIVRRPEQAEALRALGAEHIVVTGQEGWEDELKKKIKELRIDAAFDAVAGDMTGTLLRHLPKGGCVWVYGRLAPEPVGNIEALDLIYRGKEVKGFLLPTWLTAGGPVRTIFRAMRTTAIIKKHYLSVFASDFKDTTMSTMHADYCALLEKGRTGAKMRLRPALKQ